MRIWLRPSENKVLSAGASQSFNAGQASEPTDLPNPPKPPVNPLIKTAIRRTLARFGYVVRSVGHRSRVSGVDLAHDVCALLHDKRGAVLFDVGANVGQTLQEFLEAFPDPRIFSFEPSPVTFETLRRQYEGRAGIRLENVALGEREGTAPFHVTRDHSVNDSLIQPTWDARATVLPVRVETLDGYCERQAIEGIDLLKIDAQGYDLKVLRGAERMLRAGRIRLFSIEVMFVPMYEGQPSLIDIASFAEQARYQLVGFYEQTYIDDRLGYLNACFRYEGGELWP